MTQQPASTRDPRLDFFRGLALVCIAIDHMPGNRLSAYTIRNLGFSDASELFVFVSACTAGLVYMPRLMRDGLWPVARRIWVRAGQVYVTHILLMALVTVAAGWLTRTLRDRQYVQGLNVGPLLADPVAVAPDALTLSFQPTFMDILPLYVVLLAVLPAVVEGVRRSRAVTLWVSGMVYLGVRVLPVVTGGGNSDLAWSFNPLAWQFLFVGGVSLGAGAVATGGMPRSRLLLFASAAYALVAFWIGPAAYEFDGSTVAMPRLVHSVAFPVMERPNLSLFRIANILALAYLAWHVTTPGSRVFAWPVSRLLILCGRHPLALFSVGVLASVAGWAVLVEYGNGVAMQAAVNVGVVAVLVGTAWVLSRLR